MANEKQNVTPEGATSEPTQKSRRDFVKTSAQVAVTAPAVALLLSSKATRAAVSPYQASMSHILDDFTFGNNREDIDALGSGTNYTSFGKPALDDSNTTVK